MDAAGAFHHNPWNFYDRNPQHSTLYKIQILHIIPLMFGRPVGNVSPHGSLPFRFTRGSDE